MRAALAWAVAAIGMASPSAAETSMFGVDEFDISAFCSVGAPRSTIIYVDGSGLRPNDTEWAKRIDERVRGSLLPHEPVQVIALDSSGGTAKEAWRACWPDYDPEVRAELAAKYKPSGDLLSYLLTKNPLDNLPQQQSIFTSGLRGALTEIYADGTQNQQVEIGDRSLARALAADQARLVSAKAIRVILYSDMREASDLYRAGSGSLPADAGKGAVEKLALDFGSSVFYVFGATTSGADAEAYKAFWAAVLRGAGAFLAGYGSDLTAPAAPPTFAHRFDLSTTVSGQARIGRLQVFADAQGQLQDSVIFFSKDASAMLDGSLQCGSGDQCLLEARTSSGTLTLSSGEELRLTGPIQRLTGTLGFPNDVIRGEDGTSRPAVFQIEAVRRDWEQ